MIYFQNLKIDCDAHFEIFLYIIWKFIFTKNMCAKFQVKIWLGSDYSIFTLQIHANWPGQKHSSLFSV